MDLQVPLIVVSLFSLASLVLVLVYKLGIKEKSYEEALAEQRQQTQILLGIKPKLKEKKTKKPSKKGQTVIKEKTAVEEIETSNEPEQAEATQKNEDTQKKLHVEFKENVDDVTVKVTVGKKHKKEKVRPILVHKEKLENGVEKPVVNDGPTGPTNHFEESHPKDDFELFRAASVPEEVANPEKTVEVEIPKQTNKKHSEPEPFCGVKEAAPVLSAAPTNGFIGNPGKEKKKKKSEFNNIQQLAGDSNGPNVSGLLNLVRKAELSRSEVQILIDLLLNKQHEAPAVIDEWSEGKSDPVQKLKKQLAEKEKLLAEEQQALVGAQAKLREIRSEHQNEKSGLVQKMKNMEEILHGKQLESSRYQQQIQQIQNQLKDELVMGNKLKEEIAAMQIQRQQLELRLGQAQDSEVIINQLRNEVQEFSSITNQMRIELQRITEENISEKDRNQALIVQLNNFQKELEQKNRQLEDSRHQFEREMDTYLKREKDHQIEESRLNSVLQQQNEEIRRLEHTTKQYHDELQKQTEESNKVISQLTADLRQLQEENKKIQINHMNGSSQENKQQEVEILNLHNELSSVKTELTHAQKQSDKELKAANALTEKLQKELEELTVRLNEEKSKLETQKEKNNELRERNWKVMEALNAAESRIKTNSPNVKTKSEEDIQREFIQRLFPEIKNQEIVNAELFKTAGEQFIRDYIENIKKSSSKLDTDSDPSKLELQHYKKVIDSTEKMLNQLQKHIEQEEIKWRVQLAAKSDELDALKESHRKELQEKLTRLETELKKEREEKNSLAAQCKNAQAS